MIVKKIIRIGNSKGITLSGDMLKVLDIENDKICLELKTNSKNEFIIELKKVC
jgi:hypothetical protein